ncbi:MAG: SPOR domain-containing protein [Candidatus Cloacimonas sp.]
MTFSPFPTVKRILLIIILMGWWTYTLSAIRKEFQELDSQYNNGKLDELSESISNLKPANNEESACLSFYNAMLKVKTEESISAHQWLIEKYPNSPYAQKSLLELAKMYILDRKIAEATIYLNRISSTDLVERFYWLALCAWWQDDYTDAITYCDNYLRQEPHSQYSESAYYLTADCYLAQNKTYSAVTTLLKLQNAKFTDLDEQYFYYRLGYAYELSDKINDAVKAYQKGFELNKDSQVAFQIEDRLLEIGNKHRNVNISFLYPYAPLKIPIISEESPDTLNIVKKVETAPTNPVSDNKPTSGQNSSIKLKSKPKEGFWLQAGRFSVEGNANRLVVNIRLLNIPASYYEETNNGKKSWIVVCGSFADRTTAEETKDLLASNNINSFLVAY